MSLKLGQAPKATSIIPPAGNHIARCYSVIDLGTHTEDGKFGVKTNRKIRISWELPDELHTFKEEKGPEPFAVHKGYNFTVGEKATLRKDLEAWRGRPFTPDELDNFDLQDLLGVPCMLNVVHKSTEKGTYANIQSVTPLPRSLKGNLPEAHNKTVFYTITDGENEVFNAMPDFLKNQIKECAEWRGDSKSGSHSAGFDGSEGTIEDDDSIPF